MSPSACVGMEGKFGCLGWAGIGSGARHFFSEDVSAGGVQVIAKEETPTKHTKTQRSIHRGRRGRGERPDLPEVPKSFLPFGEFPLWKEKLGPAAKIGRCNRG